MRTSTDEQHSTAANRTAKRFLRGRMLVDSPKPPSQAFIFAHQASFLISGLVQTLGCQWLYYQGAANPSALLTVFAQYIGMVLVIFLPAFLSNASSSPSDSPTYVNLPPRDSEENPTTFVERTDEEMNHRLLRKNLLSFDGPSENAEGSSSNRKETWFGSISWNAFANATGIRHDDGLDWRAVGKVSVMDVSACALLTVGMFLVGSGLFQVIYSSVVGFTALLSRVFLKKALNRQQWLGIAVITVGLALSAMGAKQDDDVAGKSTDIDAGASKSTIGAFLVLVATMLYACVYTLNDHLLTNGPSPPSPEKSCVAIGIHTTILTGSYILFVTIPDWNALVLSEIHPDSSWFFIVTMYVLLVLASTAHNGSYFVLIQNTGGVATGVLQSLRAVAVFGISHVWFCGRDVAQCMNGCKGLSAVVVVVGVLTYSGAFKFRSSGS